MAINTDTVLVSHEEIEQMLDRLSSEINRDYSGRPLVVIGILTGAFIFTADLVRRLEMPIIVDFMQVSSYVGEFSSGELKIKKDLSYDIKDMDVLVVEDITTKDFLANNHGLLRQNFINGNWRSGITTTPSHDIVI